MKLDDGTGACNKILRGMSRAQHTALPAWRKLRACAMHAL